MRTRRVLGAVVLFESGIDTTCGRVWIARAVVCEVRDFIWFTIEVVCDLHLGSGMAGRAPRFAVVTV